MKQQTITMPILQPIAIPTKNMGWYKAIFVWMSTIRKWRVMENYDYTLKDGTVVRILAGFVFDGASIPRIFWAFLSPTGLLLIPGLLHDYAYKMNFIWSLTNEGDLIPYKINAGQKYWDQMFRDEAIRVNGFKTINYCAWVALRMFGWIAWNKHRRHERDINELLNIASGAQGDKDV